MNSKQRRKIKRDIEINYQHSVQVQRPRDMDWSDWDDRVVTMWMWCQTKFGKQRYWTRNHKWIGSTFYFTNAGDATFFALKWI